MIFHFSQTNHFWFDSLLYDGLSKTLVFIQITINKQHSNHYDDLYDSITKEKVEESKNNKYFHFIRNLIDKDLVRTWVFQWITDRKYEELKNDIMKFRNSHKNSNEILQIHYFLESLIDLLNH